MMQYRNIASHVNRETSLYVRITPGESTNANAFECALESLREMVNVFPCHSLIAQEIMTCLEGTDKENIRSDKVRWADALNKQVINLSAPLHYYNPIQFISSNAN